MEHELRIEIQELIKSWRKLQSEAVAQNKMSYENFVKTFSDTYNHLKGYARETKVDKEYIALIAHAYNFAHATTTRFDDRICAAFVLTERMLQYCVMGDVSAESPERVSVYALEERREVYINLEDVDYSMNELGSVMEASYWKNATMSQ